MTEDPIGLVAGDSNYYRYVRNNPVNLNDSSGLIVDYACEKSRLGLEDHINNLRKKSKMFDDLYNDLHSRGEKFLIKLRLNDVTEFDPDSRTIFINPNEDIKMITTDGVKSVGTLRRIAHEFGHAAGSLDDGPGRMNNVNKWENPIMTPIDTYVRKEY